MKLIVIYLKMTLANLLELQKSIRDKSQILEKLKESQIVIDDAEELEKYFPHFRYDYSLILSYFIFLPHKFSLITLD